MNQSVELATTAIRGGSSAAAFLGLFPNTIHNAKCLAAATAIKLQSPRRPHRIALAVEA